MEVQIVTRIFSNILQNDNNLRKQAESELDQLQQDRPGLLVILSQLPLEPSVKDSVKVLSCIILRKLIHSESDSSKELWCSLSHEHKQTIKANVLSAIQVNPSKLIKNKILDIIPSLLDSIKSNEEDWPELLNVMGTFITSYQTLSVEEAELHLLLLRNSFFSFQDNYMQEFKRIGGLLEFYLTCDQISLRTKAISVLEELVLDLNKKELNALKHLGPRVIETGMIAFKNGDEDTLKQVLIYISDINVAEGNFLRKQIEPMFTLFETVVTHNNFGDEFIKEVAFNMIQDLVKKSFKAFERDVQRIQRYIERLVEHAVSMDTEIEESWCTPSRVDFNEELAFQENEISLCMTYLEDFLRKTKLDPIYPFLQKVIQSLLENGNWVYQYVGLVLLGKLCSFFEWHHLEPVIEIVLKFNSVENPKIKWAVMFFIQEIQEHAQTDGIEQYNQHFLEAISMNLSCSVLRVKLEAYSALQILIEIADTEFVANKLESIVEGVLTPFVDLSTPINERESILKTIEILIPVAGSDFNPYALKALQIFVQFFQESHLQPAYKELNGHLVDLILTLAEICPEEFAASSKQFTQIFLNLVNSIPDSTDPIYSNFESAWDILVPIVKRNCPDMIDALMKTVIGLVEYIPKIAEMTASENKLKVDDILKEEEEQEEEVNTLKTQELCFMVEQLGGVARALEEAFVPYLEQSEKVLSHLLIFKSNSSVRAEAAQTLAGFVEVLVDSSNQLTVDKSRAYLSAIVASCDNENDFPCLGEKADALEKIFKKAPQILSAEEIFEIFSKVSSHLERIENVRNKLDLKKNIIKKENEEDNDKLNESDDADDDESVIDSIQEDIDECENTAKIIVSALGTIYLNHAPLCGNIVAQLMQQIGLLEQQNELSLFKQTNFIEMAVDITEYLGQEHAGSHWENLARIFLRHSENAEIEMSHSAIYGLGILAQKTTNGYSNIVEPSLKALNTATKSENKLTVDYAVSAVGRILAYQGSSLPEIDQAVSFYLNLMPPKLESVEGSDCIKLFLEIVETNLSFLLGTNNCNSVNLVHCLVNCYKSSASQLPSNNKIREIFKKMENDQNLLQILETAASSFSEKQVSKVKSIKSTY